MRQRGAAGKEVDEPTARPAEPRPAEAQPAEKARGQNASDVSRGTALGLAGAVALVPVLAAAAVKLFLPDVEHAKLWEKPRFALPLSRDDVGAHLQNHTLLHLGGLHRSGTTFLWEGLARHPSISPLEAQDGGDERVAPWLKRTYNEGIFVQSVYPKFGLDHKKFLLKKWVSQAARSLPFFDASFLRLREGVGRYALHPDHHLTEGSSLVHAQNQQRLFAQWGIHWDLKLPVLMEKSPSNIVIAPFLHRLWGLSLPASPAKFLFLRRHPIPTAMATLKAGGATTSDLSLEDVVEHWVVAEERLAGDLRQYFAMADPAGTSRLPYRVVVFEDLVRQPQRVLGELLAWLGLPPDEGVLSAFEASTRLEDPNAKYFFGYCKRLVHGGEQALVDHSRLVERFQDRVLRVSDYDLRATPGICKRALLGPDAERTSSTSNGEDEPRAQDVEAPDDG